MNALGLDWSLREAAATLEMTILEDKFSCGVISLFRHLVMETTQFPYPPATLALVLHAQLVCVKEVIISGSVL